MITAIRIFMLEWTLSMIDKRIAFRAANPMVFKDQSEMQVRRRDIVSRIEALRTEATP